MSGCRGNIGAGLNGLVKEVGLERTGANYGRDGRRERVGGGWRLGFLTLIAGIGVSPLLLAQTAKPAADEGYKCFSRPSEVRELSFSQRGVIAETTVKVGDSVKVGQELARMDDQVQRSQVQLAELGVADSSPMDQAKSSLEFYEEEVRLVTEAKNRSAGGNPAEMREAKYRRDKAMIDLASAKSKAKSDTIMLSREKARLDEMKILSPINGTVIVVNKRGGEGVTEGGAVVTLVGIDPLWADVNVPPRVAANLALGQVASAEWEDIDMAAPMAGKVIYIAPAADAARTVQIRIEVPNPNRVPAGLHAKVRFPASAGSSTGSARVAPK